MRFKKLGGIALVLGLLLATAGATSASAEEAVDDGPEKAAGPVVTYREVINKTSQSNYIRYGEANRLTHCVVVTSGQTCTISRTFDVTRSIGVSLGMTRAAVAASLSISSASSVSVGVSCTSPTMKVGQKYEAYPVGTRYTYKIKRWGTNQPATTSGTLSAFNPNRGIACRVI